MVTPTTFTQYITTWNLRALALLEGYQFAHNSEFTQLVDSDLDCDTINNYHSGWKGVGLNILICQVLYTDNSY